MKNWRIDEEAEWIGWTIDGIANEYVEKDAIEMLGELREPLIGLVKRIDNHLDALKKP